MSEQPSMRYKLFTKVRCLEDGVLLSAEELLSVAILLRDGDPDCAECRQIGAGMGPSHRGRATCESGSLASGGERAHCSCGICF